MKLVVTEGIHFQLVAETDEEIRDLTLMFTASADRSRMNLLVIGMTDEKTLTLVSNRI